MSKRQILDYDDDEVAELGQMSIISSNNKRSKTGNNGLYELYFTIDDEKGMPQTDLNSELPEMSIIERPPPRLKPPQSSSGRAKGIIERQAAPYKFMTQSFIEPHSDKGELKTKLLQMFDVITQMERQKAVMQQEFTESLQNLRDELNEKKKRNRTMNGELIRLRKDLNDTHRQVNMMIRVVKSGYGRVPQYHTQQLILPEKANSHQRPGVSSDTEQKTAINSKEKYKEPMLPKLPSFKGKCFSNKLLMRY